MLYDEHAKGDGDGDSEGHGDEDEREMVECGAQDFGAMLEEEFPGTHWVTPSERVRDAVKAWTSG